MSLWLFVLAFVGSAVGLWLVSQILETLRPVPETLGTLSWAADIPIGYLDVGGCKLRYIRAGRGPNLVLLHTLRTQFELCEKVVPELARRFTIVRNLNFVEISGDRQLRELENGPNRNGRFEATTLFSYRYSPAEACFPDIRKRSTNTATVSPRPHSYIVRASGLLRPERRDRLAIDTPVLLLWSAPNERHD